MSQAPDVQTVRSWRASDLVATAGMRAEVLEENIEYDAVRSDEPELYRWFQGDKFWIAEVDPESGKKPVLASDVMCIQKQFI